MRRVVVWQLAHWLPEKTLTANKKPLARLVCGLAVASAISCGDQAPPPAPQPAVALATSVTPQASAATSSVQPAPDITALRTVAEAFAMAKPVDVSVMDEKLDRGTVAFVAWALKKMRWGDVGAQASATSFAKAMKDTDAERGKPLCARGRIVQIGAQQSDAGKFFEGVMGSGPSDPVSFMAVGSTGEIVAGRAARFCGVITGRYSFGNTAGGVTHSLRLVGMFDLPENRNAPPPSKPDGNGGTVIDLESL